MTTSESSPVRAALRSAITRAMKQHDRAATAVYRSALAAVDNAEAVGPDPTRRAGAIEATTTGLGATEVQRRILTDQDVIDIVVAEAEERTAAAELVEAGDPDTASRLHREAGLLLDLVRRV